MISMISESKNLIIQNCPQRNQGIKETMIQIYLMRDLSNEEQNVEVLYLESLWIK